MMRRGRWFLLGIGVGALGAKRLVAIARPIMERPIERSTERAVRRLRGDVLSAVREAVATYRGDVPHGRVVEGEAKEFHGFK